jgi:FemAB family protein
MKEILQSVVKSFFDEKVSFTGVGWADVVLTSNFSSVGHIENTVEYYVEYFSGINLSFVIFENTKPIAVFPLFVYENDQGWIISSNGQSLIEPLHTSSSGNKKKNRIEITLKKVIFALVNKLQVTTIRVSSLTPNSLSSWYLLWVSDASKVSVTHHLLVDLLSSLKDIKLKFRKSFKPLISKSEREWNISVNENVTGKVFEEFRLLHLEVSGRQTRSLDSWLIQQKQVEFNEAFLVEIRDADMKMVGAGLFTYTKDIGQYSVGVYKRELFDKPLGHGVQAKAIEHLKSKGCKWYEIGQKQCVLDEIMPTEKELSISHFKKGFASDIFPYTHLTILTNA